MIRGYTVEDVCSKHPVRFLIRACTAWSREAKFELKILRLKLPESGSTVLLMGTSKLTDDEVLWENTYDPMYPPWLISLGKPWGITLV